MTKLSIICLTIVITTLFCTGVVNAFSVGSGTLEVNALKVSNNLRVNGLIYDTNQSNGDSTPVQIKDNLKVYGKITSNKQVYADSLYYHTSSGYQSVASKINNINSDIDSILEIDTTQTDILSDHQGYIYYINKYLDCVANLAQYTTYLNSSDTIYCWNLWMAGHEFPSSPGANFNTLETLSAKQHQ